MPPAQPVPELDVDLDLPPDRRWEALEPVRESARELVRFFVRDLGGPERFAPVLARHRDAHLDLEYVAELRAVARVISLPEDEVLLANLYYDAMKLVLSSDLLGCTGFAIDAEGGPLHARNLDWTTADGLLASETIVVRYRRGPGPPRYRVVAWPGFVGCLSGVAPGRFAVTLNAVMSEDAPGLAPPVTFVLRRLLETAAGYDEALDALARTPIASDCLLLVSGVAAGQMAVVERSPTRAAVRRAVDGRVVVTNDYRLLPTAAGMPGGSELAATSCGRFEAASRLLREAPPRDGEGCLRVLRDPAVRMSITVQQMVLSAAQGTARVELPPRRGEAGEGAMSAAPPAPPAAS